MKFVALGVDQNPTIPGLKEFDVVTESEIEARKQIEQNDTKQGQGNVAELSLNKEVGKKKHRENLYGNSERKHCSRKGFSSCFKEVESQHSEEDDKEVDVSVVELLD